MSFILDALKKSESDRQRQSGPALFEVKIAPPKARFPLWAIAIAALLGVNMVIVGWLLLRSPSHGDDATAAPGSSASPAQASGAASPPPGAPSAAIPAPSTIAGGTADGTAGVPMTGASLASARNSTSTLQQEQSTPAVLPAQGMGNSRSPTLAPATGMSESDINEPTLGGNARQAAASIIDPAATTSNPDDFTPATEPGAAPVFKSRVKRGTESGFMLYQDAALVAGSNLPNLRLDLHVYAAKPQDRFALINMHKMREGDSLADGVKVEAITPDGVVMSHNGAKFLLPRD